MPLFHFLLPFLSAIILFGYSACAQDSYHPGFAYQMDKPDQVYELSDDLEEISGLSFSADGKSLFAVQDEDGLIFKLDPATGEITDKVSFWKEGDYEGIESIPGGNTWVAKSNGSLYEVIDRGEGQRPHVVRYDLDLKKQIDVEGLAYDPYRKVLLVSCKGRADVADVKDKKVRAIYGFDPEKGELLSDDPLFLINWDEIKAFIRSVYPEKGEEIFSDFFEEDRDEIPFAPSGLAVHPKDAKLYVLSSVGKALLVLSPEGKISHLIKLEKKIHRQPEGISFDPEGVMYISNESKKDDKARILRFNAR
jgi:uncharacterized protein YjiK